MTAPGCADARRMLQQGTNEQQNLFSANGTD